MREKEKEKPEGNEHVHTRHWPWIAAGRFSSPVSRIHKAGRSVESDDKEPVLSISGPGR